MRATKKAMVRLVRAPAQMRAHRSWPMAFGAPDKALFPGGDVAELDAGGRVYLAEIGICLTGQIGLQKGKAHHEHQCNEQGHGDLILEESTEVLPQ